MRLPCEHVFAYRRSCESDLFCEEPCDEWWTTNYFKHTQRVFLDNSQCATGTANITTIISNQNERFQDASKLTTKIAALASEVGGVHYPR